MKKCKNKWNLIWIKKNIYYTSKWWYGSGMKYRNEMNTGIWMKLNAALMEMNVQNKMLEWKIFAQIYTVQSYQNEVNDKYLESSDIQHTGPGSVTSIFELSTKCVFSPTQFLTNQIWDTHVPCNHLAFDHVSPAPCWFMSQTSYNVNNVLVNFKGGD